MMVGSLIIGRKTSSRRQDNALISIKVEKEAIPIIEKYRDSTGKRVFNFYKIYAEHQSFNKAINLGLKSIGKKDDIKIPDLTFYSSQA